MSIFKELVTRVAKDGKTPIKEDTERVIRALGNLSYGECESILDESYGAGWFTSVVANEAHNRLVSAFGTIPQDWRKIVSDIVSLEDLKQRRATTFSGAPYLPSKKEHGPYESAQFLDRGETYTPTEYGRIFEITRKAKANDQIGAFQRWTAEEGKAAGRSINRFVFYDLLSGAAGDGPTMSDAAKLFVAGHSNKSSGSGALSRANLQLMFQTLHAQIGARSEKLFFNGPYYLVVGSTDENYDTALEFTAVQVRLGGTADIVAEPNLYGSGGRHHTEVIGTPYTGVQADAYLIAGDAPTFELGFYQGKETPNLMQESPGTGLAFSHDLYRYRVDMAFGGFPVEWRGMVWHDDA